MEQLKPKRLANSDSEDESTTVKLSESNFKSTRVTASDIFKRNVPLLRELDKKYEGEVSSRRDLDDSDSEAEDESDIKEEEEEEEDEGGISDFIDQFKNKIGQNNQLDMDSEDSKHSIIVDDVYEGDSAESESGKGESNEEELTNGEEEDTEDGEDEDTEDEEDGETEEELGDTREEERSMKLINPAKEDNVRKGMAVRNQLKMWERTLETRIRSQTMLNKANSLPEGEILNLLSKSSEEFRTLQSETKKNIASLLDNLIEMQNCLLSQFSETNAILKGGLYKRKFSDEIESGIDAKKLCLDFHSESSCDTFKTYRNSVIQKWADRTKVTSARNSKDLLTNHSVLNQIDAILLNKSGLIKNSQTVKGTYKLFARTNSEADAIQSSAEIYDDTDFYHQILRELIEYKSSSSANPIEAARNFAELQKLKNKIKKPVDQKASKGRKIR